ncbi:MAG: VWA domain-containing protein [Deltaproteobacteria bacterium]|nr:VWA domain-containing protein [Deltaproteobacteria bacterium]
MGFTFPSALWLWLLLLPLVGFFLNESRLRRIRLEKLGDVAQLLASASNVDVGRRSLRRALLVFAFALGVAALAGPQVSERTELLPHRGLDILFALDVSRSMRARDVLPDRLERVKAEIDLAMPRFGKNRIGLIGFAGSAYVQCPLTTDVEAARIFLRAMDPATVPQGGTDIGAGLLTALRLFEAEAEALPQTKDAGRVLVVFSDGEHHEGDLDEAAAALKKAGVSVIFIGIGSPIGEPIPVLDEKNEVIGYLKDTRGRTVMSRMDPEMLSSVADKVGGEFVDGTTALDIGLNEVLALVASLEKRDLETRTKVTGIDRAVFPMSLFMFLLLLSVLLPAERRKPTRFGGSAHS